MSADPYTMSGGLGNPQGWNRYAYVSGDPVDFNDPEGLQLRAVQFYTGQTCFYVMGQLDSCEDNKTTYWVDDGLGGGGGGGGGDSEACSLSQWISFDECGLSGTSIAAAGARNWWVGYGFAAWWAAARAVGTAGERAVQQIQNLEKNNTFTITFNGITRVPDFVNRSDKIIYEVKNVSQLSWIQQLSNMADWAQLDGYKFVLYVREGAELSPAVQEAIQQGRVVVEWFRWP